MLVLSRSTRRPQHPDHSQIVIDGNIVVTVLGIDGNKVRLGIAAPDDVPVWRGEIANREYVSDRFSVCQ